MSLREYKRKRDFTKTSEPPPARPRKTGRRFVVQKHAASRLHYDFRLELGGTLKSWAVPKGIPFSRGERRLAVHVEDHPVSYIDFEGAIPRGEYGGGTVMVWDDGTWEPSGRAPAKDLAAGKLHFTLSGHKLRGEWHLVRLREGDEWLLIRSGDDMKPVSKKADDTSVRSGKSMKELSKGDRVWSSRSARVGKTSAAPPPAFVQPMKAKLAARPPSGDWIYEIKFDGFRALALIGDGEAALMSRNEKPLGAKFPEVLEAVAGLGLEDSILDGEIVALDAEGRSSFQLLQAFDLGEERPPICYYVFDAPRLEGRDLHALPLGERKSILERALKRARDPVRFSGTLGSDAALLLERARELGLEGLVGKRTDSAYEAGRRSGAWIKLKLVHEQEFVIGGFTEPEGARKHFGALIVGVYRDGKLEFTGKVGTGFGHAALRSLHATMEKFAQAKCPFANLPQPRSSRYGQAITKAEMRRCHWIAPKLVCQVKFSEWTRDNRLRQPVFLGLRDDKDAREVVRETPAR